METIKVEARHTKTNKTEKQTKNLRWACDSSHFALEGRLSGAHQTLLCPRLGSHRPDYVFPGEASINAAFSAQQLILIVHEPNACLRALECPRCTPPEAALQPQGPRLKVQL